MYYGLENSYVNKTETKKIQTMEGIMIKRMIGVNKRTHTTNLLHAMDVEPVDLKMKKIKITFARRLLENGFTNVLIQSIEIHERIEIEK